jgi:hypothetical protein
MNRINPNISVCTIELISIKKVKQAAEASSTTKICVLIRGIVSLKGTKFEKMDTYRKDSEEFSYAEYQHIDSIRIANFVERVEESIVHKITTELMETQTDDGHPHTLALYQPKIFQFLLQRFALLLQLQSFLLHSIENTPSLSQPSFCPVPPSHNL